MSEFMLTMIFCFLCALLIVTIGLGERVDDRLIAIENQMHTEPRR